MYWFRARGPGGYRCWASKLRRALQKVLRGALQKVLRRVLKKVSSSGFESERGFSEGSSEKLSCSE